MASDVREFLKNLACPQSAPADSPGSYNRRTDDRRTWMGRLRNEAARHLAELDKAAPKPDTVAVAGSPDDLRARGLSVAVHNDYRLNGERHTFWLFTDSAGMSYKGEGRNDADALNAVRALLDQEN